MGRSFFLGSTGGIERCGGTVGRGLVGEGICQVRMFAFLTLRNSFMFALGYCQGSLFMGDSSMAPRNWFPPPLTTHSSCPEPSESEHLVECFI